MTQNDGTFAGSIPETYDNYLVPLIFESYANDLAGRAVALAPNSVLETAAGTGVVTRALTARLSSSANYTVTDLAQPMLDIAASKQEPDDRITWRQADALSLPFDDGSFDLVVCQLGVMFFPDKVAGYAETRRVLKLGGSFIFNVWDGLDANDFANAVNDAVAAQFPGDPPGFLAGAPFGYHDLDLIRNQLGEAGFSHVSIDTVEETGRAPSPRHVAIAMCQGTPIRTEIEARDSGSVEGVTDRVTEAISARFGEGAVAGQMRAHVVTATA